VIEIGPVLKTGPIQQLTMTHPESTPLTKAELEKLIASLEARLADLYARLPAHTIPPAMIAELDEIDEQLEKARARLAQIENSA
jgi:hypothetical protein